MKVKLLNHTPLWVCSSAIRTCWDSGDKSDSQCYDDLYADAREWVDCGPKDRALIERVALKFKHASTIEHLVYNFHISGVSRALLQEISRHRLASPSVKSTRYTLKELKEEEPFKVPRFTDIGWETSLMYSNTKARMEKYVIFTSDSRVNLAIMQSLENTRYLIASGISNDISKFSLCEAYATELAWTINARSLRNFLFLRTDKSALWEIRNLANMVYDVLPEDHKYLFADCLYSEPEVKEDVS